MGEPVGGSESDVGRYPGSQRSADNVVHHLIAIANDLRRHIDRTLADAGYEQRRPGMAPLLALVWKGAVPQGRLAEALGVSAQDASQTVGLAARAGFVAWVANPDDGRANLVELTDLGRAFVTDGAAAIAERAGIDAVEARYTEILGVAQYDQVTRCARDLNRMLTLEYEFALPASGASLPAAPTERRRSELADLGTELLRWLGEADAWWLAAYLRQQEIARIEEPVSGPVDAGRRSV